MTTTPLKSRLTYYKRRVDHTHESIAYYQQGGLPETDKRLVTQRARLTNYITLLEKLQAGENPPLPMKQRSPGLSLGRVKAQITKHLSQDQLARIVKITQESQP